MVSDLFKASQFDQFLNNLFQTIYLKLKEIAIPSEQSAPKNYHNIEECIYVCFCTTISAGKWGNFIVSRLQTDKTINCKERGNNNQNKIKSSSKRLRFSKDLYSIFKSLDSATIINLY